MPSLLDAAMQQAEFEMDKETEERMMQEEDEDIQIAHINDKCVSIRTSILEEKATACQMLSSMVADLKEDVEQVTQVLTPLMTDSVHTEIRTASISAMPSLVLSVSKHLNMNHGDKSPVCYTDAGIHFGSVVECLIYRARIGIANDHYAIN